METEEFLSELKNGRKDFSNENLAMVELNGASLVGVNLRGANLRGAYMKYADLRGANLRGADLQGADLEGACMEGAKLEGANLEGGGDFLIIIQELDGAAMMKRIALTSQDIDAAEIQCALTAWNGLEEEFLLLKR